MPSLSFTSLRKRLPAVPLSLPSGLPPWILLLIPLLGGLISAYSLLRAAGPPSWVPGIEALEQCGTEVSQEELKEEKEMGRKHWQLPDEDGEGARAKYEQFDVIICGGGTTGEFH